MAENDTRIWIGKAFKKLKGSAYFDKTQLPLLNKLVCFEDTSYPKELDRMATLLENGNEAPWADYTADIIDKNEFCRNGVGNGTGRSALLWQLHQMGK